MALDFGVPAIAIVLIALVWLHRINSAMQAVPEQAAKASPHRWTPKQIQETYERVKKTPVDFTKHLPPRLDRRYVVFGGAGMVGGDIVMQLLARGQSPESIRIVDFQPVNRSDMLASDKVKACDYVKADMTSSTSVDAAFSKKWPASVAKLPLTVYHTAAAINPADRKERLYERIRRVNVDGTANVVEAARKAGADIFVATSSASVSFIPADLLVWPWQSTPGKYFHVSSEADFDAPIRPHDQFFSNYSRSKAEAERIICGANKDNFRTGTIRPGNGIYGQKTDPIVGALLQMGDSATWIAHLIQNFVASRNIALAHLLFEAALARKKMPACAGRPFNITDAGPPIAFQDFYDLVIQLSVTPVKVASIPPALLLMVAYHLEWYVSLVTRFPFLTKLGLKEPKYPISYLQPSVMRGSIHTIIDDSKARRSVEEGGLGYQGVCNSLEGMCEQLLEWNLEHQGDEKSSGSKVESAGATAKAVGA